MSKEEIVDMIEAEAKIWYEENKYRSDFVACPYSYIAGRSKNIERIENLEEFVEQFIPDPYPEDVFLPVTSDELKQIHAMLQIKFNMPLDRLAGHIGRLLRNPLRAEAKQLLTK